jgi:hypothetical protein
MTDIRRCDGPHCRNEVNLDTEHLSVIGQLGPQDYITVECPTRANLHFHDAKCLKAYYGGEN